MSTKALWTSSACFKMAPAARHPSAEQSSSSLAIKAAISNRAVLFAIALHWDPGDDASVCNAVAEARATALLGDFSCSASPRIPWASTTACFRYASPNASRRIVDETMAYQDGPARELAWVSKSCLSPRFCTSAGIIPYCSISFVRSSHVRRSQ